MTKAKAKPKDRHEKNVWLWLSPADHQRLREAAAKNGVPMSEFSRNVVLEAVNRVLGERR